MSVAKPLARYTIDEYVRLEEYSNVKHQYLSGQIHAMAGGTPEHGALAVRVCAALVAQLRGRRCSVYSSDVRIRVVATGLDTYPDASVVCGKEVRDADDKNALTNPILVVEVLSPSTEEYDRGEKLDHYKQIPSLRDVLIVASDPRSFEVWHRSDEGSWSLTTVLAGARAHLASIDCVLDVDDVFRDPLTP